MARSISAYEAPALLDVHSTLTRHALYERLAGRPESPPQAGLNSFIDAGVLGFVAEENGWTKPVRYDFRKGADDGYAIDGKARAYKTGDENGEFLAVFVHLAGFMHSMAWGKAGVPPEAFQVQANWTMALADAKRLAYVVLADRRTIVYWVDRDESIVKRLMDGLADMDRRLETGDAPPIDATPATPEPVAGKADAAPVDLDSLCMRFRASQVARATAQNDVQTADHAYEAAVEALKKALPPGSHHDYEGFRIHNNAKSGRLTEEKIDGQYF